MEWSVSDRSREASSQQTNEVVTASGSHEAKATQAGELSAVMSLGWLSVYLFRVFLRGK
jgi:hypothetical protein